MADIEKLVGDESRLELGQKINEIIEDKVSKSGDTMTGTLALEGGIDVNGTTVLPHIEFKNASNNCGGYIDFHYNGDSSDYTSRIIEDELGRVSIYAPNYLYTPTPPYGDGSDKVATTHFVKYILANSGFGLADIDKNGDGYVDFAIGFKVRWGQITFASGSHTANVNFKKPFNTTAPKVVLFRKSGADTTVTDGEVWCRGTSTTGFNLYQTSTQPYGYMWIAIGY